MLQDNKKKKVIISISDLNKIISEKYKQQQEKISPAPKKKKTVIAMQDDMEKQMLQEKEKME